MYVISYKRNYISVSIIYTQTKHTHWEENRGRDLVNLLYQCHVWMGLLLDRSLKLGLALEVGVLRSPPQISTHISGISRERHAVLLRGRGSASSL